MSSPTSELAPNKIQRLVRAGAGAGKTTDLVRRVLDMEDHFWKTENRHCHLVVTTFTRKATQELRERLMAEALLRGQPALLEFVQRPSHLHISTIHGVLSLYLTRFGSEMGLGPEFQILSSHDLTKFAKRSFRRLIQEDQVCAELASEFLESLDLKTLLAAFEVYYGLWCQGLDQRVSVADLEKIFEKQMRSTTQKLGQLIEWIDREDCPEKWTAYRERLMVLEKALAAADLGQKRILLQEFSDTVSAPSRSAKRPSEDLGEFKKEVHEDLKELTEPRWAAASFQAHEQLTQKFEKLALKFCEKILEQKISSGSLSLADLELLSFRLVQNHPETAKLFSGEWDYWMIDEYQDTSPLQVKLIELLMGDKKSFIVGDPQQSIYLFRGARSEVFAEKEQQIKTLPADQGEALQLMKNYRSRPEVLSFFNAFFTSVASKQFQPMQIGYNKDLVPVEAEAVQYIRCEAADQEIESALVRAVELQHRGVPLEQICILSRSNDALAKLARQALKANLPVQVHSSTQFSGRREVQDAVGLLKFLVNPFDNINFLQLLRSPWLKVADQNLQVIAGWGEEAYYQKALKLSQTEDTIEGSVQNWSAVKKLSVYLEISKLEGVSAAWLKAMTQLAFLDLSRKLDNSGRREANLWKLVSLVHQAEKLPGFSILQFISQITQVQVDSEGDSDATPVIEPQRVNLMTVHASKGLQFQYVIILGLGKRFPTPRSSFLIFDSDSGKWTLSLQDPIEKKWVSSPYGQMILKKKAEREELEAERVLYVAVTRAILGVTLIWSEASESSRAKSWVRFVPQEIRVAALSQSEVSELERSDIIGSESFQDQEFIWKVRTQDLSLIFQKGFPDQPLVLASEAVRAPWAAPVHDQELVRTSVTAVIEASKIATTELGAKKEVADKHSLTSVKSLEKALRGVEVHRMFESLKYQQNYLVTEPLMLKAMKFVQRWEQGRILDWIRNGEVEWGFAAKHEGMLIQGQIDLWSVGENEVVVVDYKTGSQVHLEKAFQQLEIYAWALMKMNKIPTGFTTKLVVIYPFDEVVFLRTQAPGIGPIIVGPSSV